MDTIFIDPKGNTLFQLMNHSVPSVLAHPDNDYSHINKVLCHQSTNHYYHYINTYGLEYITVGIWRGLPFVEAWELGLSYQIWRLLT